MPIGTAGAIAIGLAVAAGFGAGWGLRPVPDTADVMAEQTAAIEALTAGSADLVEAGVPRLPVLAIRPEQRPAPGVPTIRGRAGASEGGGLPCRCRAGDGPLALGRPKTLYRID